MAEISDLLGVTLTSIDIPKEDDRIVFTADDGRKWKMYHSQDCCESVEIEEIVGDISDLIGSPLLEAEEVSNYEGPKDKEPSESFTWTFYKLGTIKGHVTLRWLGQSNGYYSESVDFEELTT